MTELRPFCSWNIEKFAISLQETQYNGKRKKNKEGDGSPGQKTETQPRTQKSRKENFQQAC
jgi:hypothetical protein